MIEKMADHRFATGVKFLHRNLYYTRQTSLEIAEQRDFLCQISV